MNAKRQKMDSDTSRPVTQKEMQALKLELASLRAGLQHFKSLFNDITGLLQELKKEPDSTPTSSDSGMSSETKKPLEDRSNKNDELSKVEDGKPTKVEVKESTKDEIKKGTDSVEVRPVIPLLYGIICHNPKKERKSAPPEVSQNDPKVAVVAPSAQVASPDSYGYLHKKKKACKQIPKNESSMVPIGTGKTMVPRNVYNQINWGSHTIATRKLLMASFSRKVLATHSLTGKASPAFADKPAKLCLDPKKILDIIIEVTDKCKVKENLVRSAITTKCADEYKMMRIQAKKRNTTI